MEKQNIFIKINTQQTEIIINKDITAQTSPLVPKADKDM